MEIRGGPRGRDISDDDARGILTAVLDSGITYIDTSNDYGRSEELMGRFIGSRRDDYFLATKCGCIPGGGEHIWTRENMFRGLEESLRRLQTDYVDVMQLHNATVAQCETEGVVDTLEEMRSQGKVRWIGASTTIPHLPTYIEWGVFDVFQIPYAAVLREHEEWITKAAQAGIGTVIRGGVGKGEPASALPALIVGPRMSGPDWTTYARKVKAPRPSCCATPWRTPTSTPSSPGRSIRITWMKTSPRHSAAGFRRTSTPRPNAGLPRLARRRLSRTDRVGSAGRRQTLRPGRLAEVGTGIRSRVARSRAR